MRTDMTLVMPAWLRFVCSRWGGRPKGETFNAVVDTVWSLTTEDFFNMPDRSLAVLDAPSENARYLNIPAQLVFRDTVTQQFTFTGLFFSEDAVYTND